MDQLLNQQKAFFQTGATRTVEFRTDALRRLKSMIIDNRQALDDAIFRDFGKSPFENILTELYVVIDEIDRAVFNLPDWSSTKPVPSNALTSPGDCFIIPEPLGTALIIGPWNYPYQLTFAPLVAAISAGCTAVIKPSELTPYSSAIIETLISKYFPPSYITVVPGSIPETTALLAQKFDKIFFTGSVPVGKIVYRAAAENLTPVTLELGGKSPVIVMPDADLALTAQRIVWGKFLNSGQTCIAPDYIYVHKSVEQQLLGLIRDEIQKREYDFVNGNYVQIVNEKNTSRLVALINPAKVFHGGSYDIARRWIEPTVMNDITWEDRVMQEEIFGPLLPVLGFDDTEEAIREILLRPRPLALYLFTNNETLKSRVLSEISFGGGCVNDTVMQIANGALPFGGVGDSGMGSYHAEQGFRSFSHYKSIVSRPLQPEPELKYAPYTAEKMQLLQSFLS